MPSIPYDASRASLLHPASRPTLFSKDSAKQLPQDAIFAECARLAYLRFESDPAQRQQLTDALSNLDATALEFFNHAPSDTQAYGAVLPDIGTLVAFRGTEPDRVKDLVIDAEAGPTAWIDGSRVHTGFARAFAGVRAAIEAWLAQRAATRPIVTGHSLGAALATLAASVWSCTRLTTIGSPRVGDAKFVGTIRAPVFRYVDCCDLVTRIPPDGAWYEHVGERLYIDRNGQLQPGASDADVEDDQKQARENYLLHMALVPGNNPVRDLSDHAPNNYLRALFP